MELMESLRVAIQEWIVPELDKIRLENAEIRTAIQLTNKRLDDIQAQLIDQSRRIDETNRRIDRVHDDLLARIDETNKRIDQVHGDLLARIDETNKRVDRVREELFGQISETNRRLDRLYEVIVRREEHASLHATVQSLEQRVHALELKLAA